MTSSHESKPRGMALHTTITLGLLGGAAAGLIANSAGLRWPATQESITFAAANVLEPIGKVFLRLVLMVVVPLVVSALALGVLELGDVRRLGRVGLRTLGYTLVLSGASVAIGI